MSDGSAATKRPTLQSFRLRTQLLKQGRTHHVIASTKADHGAMNIAIKCYADGGENTLHAHAGEDHSFIILQGRARFVGQDGQIKELGRNEGILVPAGCLYRFSICSKEPLVMVRVGNVYQPVTDGPIEPHASQRIDPSGKPLSGYAAENKHVEPVVIDGAWFE
jgi:mannose-6-phosphate isomerase-like protein (cupin superfamily)